MQVNEAKAAARRWVLAEARKVPGYSGAFFHGSTNWLAGDAMLAATSDLDVMVVLDDTDVPAKPGKVMAEQVMLDVTYISRDELSSAEQILKLSHLAGSFHAPGIIDDPTGQLTALQQAVAVEYPRRRWVRARCEHAAGKLKQYLQSIDPAAPFHNQVMSWLFGTSLTTHVLLAAGLRNPTVRKRYVSARELLLDYGHSDLYVSLLEQLGCAAMSRQDVERHLDTLGVAFDVAATTIKTPVFFASDISEPARPIAIDGSRDLVEQGLHREAIFWIVATYSRCMIVFQHDAPPELERFDPGYRELLDDLGVISYADMVQRREQVLLSLPRVWEVAEAIIDANPEIRS